MYKRSCVQTVCMVACTLTCSLADPHAGKFSVSANEPGRECAGNPGDIYYCVLPSQVAASPIVHDWRAFEVVDEFKAGSGARIERSVAVSRSTPLVEPQGGALSYSSGNVSPVD